MTTTDYLINAVLVVLVLRQARERRVDLHSLVLPVVLVALAGQHYLHTIPTAGNDLVLVFSLAGLGIGLGLLSGYFTSVRVGGDGVALARVGWLAGILLIAGIGSRMVFVYAVHHGAGPAIARFSAANAITGADAWAVALVMMALCEVAARLVTVHLRAHQLTGAPSRAGLPIGAVR